jgi:CRISPR-associated protein Csb2
MPSHFCLSIRFLEPAFHGRRDGGEPEWPPSPLRVFQALVAASGARRRPEGWTPGSRAALEWLERQAPPLVVAPAGATASGYRLSVPPNAMDIVARAWCRGVDTNAGHASPATLRTMKTVRPTLLLDGDLVHYLWALPDPLAHEARHVDELSNLARSVVALGWGVDLVVANGAIVSSTEAGALSGEQWLPSAAAPGGGLRVPKPGTLDDVIHRHERFLTRLDADGFTAPPPLSVYDAVAYRRATDPRLRPVAPFALLKLDVSGFRSFDTVRGGVTVAGMTRHAARSAAESAGWDERRIHSFILGHADSTSAGAHVAVGPRRFSYLPLPTIATRADGSVGAVGSVHRVMLSTFADDGDAEIAWGRRAMSGRELVDEHERRPVALLSLIPENEKIVRHYTQPAASWATVTPVVLPGYDDPAHFRRRLTRARSAEEQRQLLARLDKRVEGLLRKAIVQSGFSQVLADRAELQWRKAAFWPGADFSDRYTVPHHLRRFPRVHVRLDWRDGQGRPVPVAGPLCVGSGRFYGLGLFAAL